MGLKRRILARQFQLTGTPDSQTVVDQGASAALDPVGILGIQSQKISPLGAAVRAQKLHDPPPHLSIRALETLHTPLCGGISCG